MRPLERAARTAEGTRDVQKYSDEFVARRILAAALSDEDEMVRVVLRYMGGSSDDLDRARATVSDLRAYLLGEET